MQKLTLIASHLTIALIAAGMTYYYLPDGQLNSAGVGATLPADPYLDDLPGIVSQAQEYNELAQPFGTRNTIFSRQYAAHQLAASSDFNATKEHLTRYLTSDDPFHNINIAFIFLERLIELDVTAALDFVDRVNAPYKKKKQLYSSIVTSWARHDPQRAVAYYLTIEGIDLKQTIGARLLLDNTFAQSEFFDTIKNAMGTRADQLIARFQYQNAPPEDAFETALSKQGRNQRGALSQATNRWYQQDPEAALQRVLNMVDGNLKEQALASIVNIEAGVDAFAALELLRTYLPEGSRHEANIMSQLLTQDPDRGLPIVEDYVQRTGNIQALSQAVSVWVRTDPDAAIAYASALSRDDRQIVLASASMAYLSEHPEKAMDWIMSLDDEQIQRSALGSLPHIDPDLAESWLRRSEADQTSALILQGLAGQKAQHGLESALTWASGYEDNPGYSNAVRTILSQHSHQNPQSVADYLFEYVDDAAMANVFTQIGMNWGNKSPEAALNWIESLPAGNNRDGAASAYIMSIAQRDVDLAVDLIDSMDVKARDQVAFQLAHQLLRRDPGDKDAIARRLRLSPELSAQLRQPSGFAPQSTMSRGTR
ncbi:MAG: thioredoxin-like negative regulator of GroEL [Candidatus Azotimanducaceae bacterium]|jgi:thioredoxin-like negative regulator of GroEL